MDVTKVSAAVFDAFDELHGCRHQDAIREHGGDLAHVGGMMRQAEELAKTRVSTEAWGEYRDWKSGAAAKSASRAGNGAGDGSAQWTLNGEGSTPIRLRLARRRRLGPSTGSG